MTDHDVRGMFEQAVERFGERTAFLSGPLSVTYAELDRAAAGLAARLVAHGVEKGSAVAILSSRSFDHVLGILAILKAGGRFVPLEPRTPPRRLAAMLALVSPRCFLLGEGGTAALAAMPASGAEAAVIELDGRPESDAGGSAPPVEIGPDDACYVYFTSGSTGQPKGIAGRYKSIGHFIRWEIETFGVAAGWRVSQLTAPSFDAFLRDLFTPLCAGGTICAPESRDVVMDAERLSDWLAAARVNVVHTVPSLFRTLLHVSPPRPLPDLRWVLLAGEPLLPSDVKHWTELYGTAARLVNLYGPTETTMTKLFHCVVPGDGEKRSIPIGKPMPGARALVLDARGRTCPPRGVGEIHIRTPYRSLGYVGREDLTREAFIPNPFSSDPNDLIYKTGDLGRQLEDGTFELLGRRDNQVKIRGVRLELTEIEDLLLTHGQVREAAVVDREDENGTRFLCAYVVAAQPLGGTELRDFLAQSLPEYALPSVFVSLGSLPRTLSGKVDRRSLPAPEKLRAEAPAGFVAPRSGSEEMVAEIFARVLGRARVGVHESFFALGGHSLLATQLLSQVRTAFGAEVALRALFEAPTISGLTAIVEAALRGGGEPQTPPLVPVPRSGALPLSFAQERLWMLDQLQPDTARYNVPLAVHLQGTLRPVAVTAALAEIGRRHEVLRTTFQVAAGRPCQAVSPDSALGLAWIDLHGLAPARREREAAAWIETEARRPFDLSRGPLSRVVLFQTGERDHLVLLTMHHIASDAWSLGVFLREFGALYQALVEGRPPLLPALPVQYADFAVWQRSWLAGEPLDRQMAYWKTHLEGADEPLELPADRPRPAVAAFRGERRRALLDGHLTARLKELAASQGSTLFMVLMGGFLAWLHRLTGQRRIALGVPVANRSRSEIEGLIGFFVNTLVPRTGVAGDLPFRDLLARVREAALGAYAHQDLPFEKLVEELRPERDLAHTPLFQVMLVLQNTPLDSLELPGLRLTPVPVDTGVARFDLTLVVAEEAAGLAMLTEHAADLFDGVTIERMLRQIERLLAAAVAHPAAPIEALALLAEGEQQQVLREWNDAAGPEVEPRCLHELFESCTDADPEAPAVDWDGGSLTYGELERRANRLAWYLRGLGVGPESLVGLCTERTAALPVGALGILKAGGAFVPLDPSYPPERLSWMAGDAGLTVLVGETAAVATLPAGRARRVLLDAPPPELAGESTARPPWARSPQQAAYLIYTSGSTGRPKGVLVEHRGLANLAAGQKVACRVGPGDTVLQMASPAFDAVVFELVMGLCHGGRLCLAARESLLPGAGLLEILKKRPVTHMTITPSVLRELPHEDLPELRTLVVAGEPCPAELVARWAPGRRLVNAYGPTEATVWATAELCTPSQRAPAIGRPIANMRVALLDSALRPVPVGVAGELCLGGDGVARGYLGLPARTAERFVPDPYGERAGSRLYRTGDLGRHRADGRIELLGRADEQVKMRGVRIELGEIESALRRHAAVRDAAVMALDESGHGRQGRRLVAWVVVADRAALPASAELRRFLAGWLPEPMIPAVFVPVDALPLTPNGKLDRSALARLAPDEPAAGGTAPRNRTEEILAGIWAEILHRETIGAHDDFFAAGGHSLLAMQVISRTREVFGVELPLRALFEAPTLADLASRVADARGVQPRGPRIERVDRIERIGQQDGLPLSFGQQRLWFLAQLEPASPAYNLPAALRLEGALDLGSLRSVLNEIVRRHEVLRTTFQEINGKARQRIAAPGAMALPLADLGALPGGQRESEARRLVAGEAGRPFQIDREPLLRVTLIRLAAADHLALITMHHVASDGWSWPIFVGELAALYTAFSAGKPSPLPELPVQYADYACWQRGWLQGAALAAELGYWRHRLRGAPALLDLPLDRPRPAVRSWRGGVRSLALTDDLSRHLSRLSRREGTTLFMTLLAAFQALLRRHGAQEIVPVGIPIAGRNRLELEPLIGFFVNTLVLATDLGADPTFCEQLALVREAMLDADAHQELPFEKLVEELEPERDLSRTPLFQVMLAFQVAPPQVPDPGGLRIAPVASTSGATKLDLTLLVRQDGERVSLTLEHATELFDGATAQRILLRLESLLTGAAADPGCRLSALPLLAAEERYQLLHAWNDTAAPAAAGPCAHQLFALQAANAPGAIALEAPGLRLTYAELNSKADRLASRLRARGVRPDVPVGLFVERSPEMVIGVLGILKAGGAYLPLDPTYPREHQQFLLADSRAPFLLTCRSLLASLPASSAEPVFIDEIDEPEEVRDGGGSFEPDLANLAYILYTSGSTGRPKGVMVTHQGLLHYLNWSTRAYPGNGSGAPLLSPLGFDLTVTSLFTPLLAAQPVVLLPAGNDPDSLAEELRDRRGFAFVKLTPAHLEILAQTLPAASRAHLAGALILGGEALPAESLAPWRAAAPSLRLFNEYGPTEAVVGCCVYEAPSSLPPGWQVPIGRPIPNVRLYVLDARLEPVPAGVTGELYIAGQGLARGYLDRPAQTAERFLPDSFSALPGSRSYRTGDLVRYRPDGNLEFIGRLDQQVKVRGFRIEPGEIEVALLRCAGVREAVVVAREDTPGNKKLVAYLVAAPGAQSQARDLLRASLPPHMIPAAFVSLDALPLTANGKLDRRALPAPAEAVRPDLPTGYAAPESTAERQLAAIWSQVLRVEPVGRHDNFFQLGGDSILSIQIVSRASRAGLLITARQIFEHQTIAALAAAAGAVPRSGARREAVTGEWPLTPAQCWFFAAEPADPHHYNQSVLLAGDGQLDEALLRLALAHLLHHHDALRLRFEHGETGWRQISQPPGGEPPAASVDLGSLPPALRTAALTAAAAALQGSLDLGNGPLVRAVLFRGGPGQPAKLLLALHHLAVDGVSWRIFLEDLETAYGQLVRGARVELPPATTSYGEWAQRLAEHAAGRVDHELAFWTAPSRAHASRLPVDRTGENTVSTEDHVTVSLDTGETAALLKEVPQAYRTQSNDVLLTALLQSFAAWTGEDSLLFDLEGHGREEILEDLNLARTVGWFTSIFPMLLSLHGAGDPGDALIAIKEQLRAVPERGIGYGILRYLAGGEVAERLRILPAAEVSFNYLGQLDATVSTAAPFRPAEEPVGPLRSPRQCRRYAIEITAMVFGGRLRTTFSYSRSLHRRETVERLAERFLGALRELVEHCRSPWARAVTPSDFPLLSLSREQLAKAIGQVGQAKGL